MNLHGQENVIPLFAAMDSTLVLFRNITSAENEQLVAKKRIKFRTI